MSGVYEVASSNIPIALQNLLGMTMEHVDTQ